MKEKDKKREENQESEEKDFKVEDKRKIGKEGGDEEKSEKPSEKTAPQNKGPKDGKSEESRAEEPPESKKQEIPPIDFASFIISLSTSVLIYLGEIPDPLSNEKKEDFISAKQTIDLISLLKEKTKGNLTQQEEEFMENILYDLKMRFVKASK